MSNVDAPNNSLAEVDRLREEWLSRLKNLVDDVKKWAEELGWSTRRIEVRLDDSQIGAYRAPALILQEEATKVLLEPIARSAPGVDGVVDLYLMPAFDDIASLYYCGGEWQLHYMFHESPVVGNIREAASKPLSKETFRDVVEEMRKNVA